MQVLPGFIIADAHSDSPHERLGEFRKESQEDDNVQLSIPPHGGLAIAKTVYKLIATAHGCGTFGGDLVVKEVCGLVNNASEPGSAAPDYQRTHEDLHNVLGPTRIQLYSRHFLIAGFIRISVKLPEVNYRFQVDDVQLVITQDVTLQSLEKPECMEHAKPLDLPLWKLSNADQQEGETFKPILLERGEAYSVAETVR